MKRITAVSGAGITAVVMTLTLGGCGASTKTDEAPTTTTSAESSNSGNSATEPTTEPTTSADPQAAGGQNLDDYITQNGLQKTVLRPGESGPQIVLGVPQGWSRVSPSADDTYGGMVYDTPVSKDKPPRIKATLFKLTGNVDQAKVLELAPMSLKNIPGFQPLGDVGDAELGGFKASQTGGSYTRDGDSWLIAQKSAVIPTEGGVFVFQITAEGLESDMPVLMGATETIDNETTITP